MVPRARNAHGTMGPARVSSAAVLTRSISRAGRDVTVIGLGTRGLGGGLRDLEPADAARAVAAAIEAGCTLIDASPAWGDALAVIGRALRELRARDRVCLACAVPRAGGFAVGHALPPTYVQRSVEDSLRATRLEAIPLAMLGAWDDTWLDDNAFPELLATLHRLVREGKVLAWGVLVPDDPSDAVRLAAEPWPAAISVRASLFDQAAFEAVVPAAAKAGIAVFAREPLARGALSGTLGPRSHFPPEDERLGISAARLDALVPELAHLSAYVTTPAPAAAATQVGRTILSELRRADDLEIPTVAELALRFVVDTPGITAAVAGTRAPLHAALNLAAADGRPLPARIRTALLARRWGEGWYG